MLLCRSSPPPVSVGLGGRWSYLPGKLSPDNFTLSLTTFRGGRYGQERENSRVSTIWIIRPASHSGPHHQRGLGAFGPAAKPRPGLRRESDTPWMVVCGRSSCVVAKLCADSPSPIRECSREPIMNQGLLYRRCKSFTLLFHVSPTSFLCKK